MGSTPSTIWRLTDSGVDGRAGERVCAMSVNVVDTP